MMLAVAQPALSVGWPEFGLFMLANAIIFYICFGRLWLDIKRWAAERRAR